MDSLDNLKTVIDDNLSHIQVTKKLQKKTLRQIMKKDNPFFSSFKHHWMKLATTFSIFAILLTISMNQFLYTQDRPASPDIQSKIPCPDTNQFNLLSNEPTKQGEMDDQCQIPNE